MVTGVDIYSILYLVLQSLSVRDSHVLVLTVLGCWALTKSKSELKSKAIQLVLLCYLYYPSPFSNYSSPLTKCVRIYMWPCTDVIHNLSLIFDTLYKCVRIYPWACTVPVRPSVGGWATLEAAGWGRARSLVSVMQRLRQRPHIGGASDHCVSGGYLVTSNSVSGGLPCPCVPRIRPLITYQTCYGR